MDDEDAAQKAFLAVYPFLNIEICLFHINKNFLKNLAKKRLITFFRKVRDQDKIEVYRFLKRIFAIAFLPCDKMSEAFTTNRNKVMRFINNHFNNYQISQFKEYFQYMSVNYFENESQKKRMCKYKTIIRTTNLIESQHSTFNKSVNFDKNQTKQVVVFGNYL